MADEKPAGTGALDDSAYQKQLAEMVRRDVESLGIATEPKPKPETPAPDADKPEEDPESTDSEETEEPETEDTEGEEAPAEKGKYSQAFRKLQKQEADLQTFKSQLVATERELKQREQKQQSAERELGDWIKSLRLDPFGTLLKAGILNEEDAEYVSKQLYYHSKAANQDPKNRVEAERLRRERELLLEQQQTRMRIEQMERERQEEKSRAAREQETNTYVAKLDATIDTYKTKTPLLAQALEKNPTRTRKELFEIATELSNAKQAWADPGLVVLAWAKQRKALLAELGITVPGAAKTNQDKSKNAAKEKGATNGKTNAAPAQPKPDGVLDEDSYQRELKEYLAGNR